MSWNPENTHPADSQVTRCAIYARYSSDLQRATSIEDQIRECRDAAARRGWTVLDDYIRSDQAASGQLLSDRQGLDELIKLAKQPSPPFDGIIIDDTSRFGRNLSDTLPLSDVLEFLGIFLYFVNRRLDSRDPNFRTLFISSGQQDEQYSRGVGEKVHRGQRGRIMNGFCGSGRAYGYTNVPIESLTRKGLHGRPFVEAVKLVRNPEEAAVVVWIFEMYVSGLGCRAIAKKLRAEGIPSPLQGQSPQKRIWNVCSVRGILNNEKYRGVNVWNRTKVVRNPITQRKEQRPRPESEWERVEVPDWRIVSEELWDACHKEIGRRQGPSWWKEGGLNRTAESRKYIFSGLLICSECGGNMNIVGGKGRTARYGCIGHRYRGTCNNKLTISRHMLEHQLLEALSHNLLGSLVHDQLHRDFNDHLTAAWEEEKRKAQQVGSTVKDLREKRRELGRQAENLLDAIAHTKGSSLLYERLNALEAQILSIDNLLATQVDVEIDPPSADAIKEFLDRKLSDLRSVLLGEPELAKQKLRKYVKKLLLTPVNSDGVPRYEVSGDVRLFAAEASNDVELAGSLKRTSKLYTDWKIPFHTVVYQRPATGGGLAA
jgi:site-specific DNA recombinase